MHYFFITGTSSGIGQALVEKIIMLPACKVFGIGRKCIFDHPQYEHIYKDLSIYEPNGGIKFDECALQNPKKIVLINNAGIIQPIKYSGNSDSKEIYKNFMVNLISPALIINSFIKFCKELNGDKIILNVSSGAAEYPIDGWSSYCSSKSGLNMISEVIDKEFKISELNFRIFSVAPGIVDTKMQTELRECSPENFSLHHDFVSYYEHNQLKSTSLVADEIMDIINNPDHYTDTIIRLKN